MGQGVGEYVELGVLTDGVEGEDDSPRCDRWGEVWASMWSMVSSQTV